MFREIPWGKEIDVRLGVDTLIGGRALVDDTLLRQSACDNGKPDVGTLHLKVQNELHRWM